MKLLRLALILVITVTALGLGNMPAQAAGRFSYMSSILVQNLDNVDGHITLYFYDTNGVQVHFQTDPILANKQNTYFPLPAGVGDNFNGSVVITSETNVASISNVHGGQSGNDYYASGAYIAQSAGDTTISIPLLMKGNGQLNTWFNIQNAGSADATNVVIKYSDKAAPEPAVAIKKGAAKTFDQTTEAHNAKIFAATITSDQPIVVTVIEESASILYAYNGFTTGNGTKFPVFPLFHANNSGYFSAVNLQNQGGVSTDVTITYTAGEAGTTCTEKATVNAKENVVFGFVFNVPIAGHTSNCAAGVRFVGSAEVTANSAGTNLVAVVNQWNGNLNGGAYNGFNRDAATGRVVLPLVFDRRGGDQYWTSAGIRNVGTVPTTVTCTFTPPAGSSTPVTYTVKDRNGNSTIDPGKGITDYHINKMGANYLGSGSCVANAAGAKIIAIVNELGASTAADQLLTYEGINSAP